MPRDTLQPSEAYGISFQIEINVARPHSEWLFIEVNAIRSETNIPDLYLQLNFIQTQAQPFINRNVGRHI